MSPTVYHINGVLARVVARVPIGTTLGLFHLLWSLLSGCFLRSRGGVTPALDYFGLPPDAVRRSAAALTYGSWTIDTLVKGFAEVIDAEGRCAFREYEGYRPLDIDLVGFRRPRLKDCETKHYDSQAGKAVRAIVIGLSVRVGTVETAQGEKRVAVPVTITRPDPDEVSEKALRKKLLGAAAKRMGPNDATVTDRGFPLGEIHEAKIKRYVGRVDQTFTAERATPKAYPGPVRPAEHGEIVRPLARTRKGKRIEATPPDRTEEWTEDEGDVIYRLRAEWWDDLVLPGAGPTGERFGCAVIYDPRYPEPLVVCTPMRVSGRTLRALYRERWVVENPPLVAKQMLGVQRQFVFGKESRYRLPELALLGGAILGYIAAVTAVVASGFWDRRPKATSGRLRRVLESVHYGELGVLPKRIRRKESDTARLPKGAEAPRRRKGDWDRPETKRIAA